MIAIGEKSLTGAKNDLRLALPRSWVRENGAKKGDVLGYVGIKGGFLVITDLHMSKKAADEVFEELKVMVERMTRERGQI